MEALGLEMEVQVRQQLLSEIQILVHNVNISFQFSFCFIMWVIQCTQIASAKQIWDFLYYLMIHLSVIITTLY